LACPVDNVWGEGTPEQESVTCRCSAPSFVRPRCPGPSSLGQCRGARRGRPHPGRRHPAVARVPFAQAAPSDPAPAFASSFETGQRPLDWTSTVEVGRDGAPKASGVTGPTTTGIPGDITSQVSGVTASSDNPPGETAAKAADGDVNSTCVDFRATGWINVTFSKATTVKRYALVSANDGRSGTPGAWQLYDSNDGITLDHPGHEGGAELRPALPGAVLRLPNTTAYTVYRLNVTRCKGRIVPRCWP